MGPSFLGESRTLTSPHSTVCLLAALPLPPPQSLLKPRLKLLIVCSFASSRPQEARSSEQGLWCPAVGTPAPGPPFPNQIKHNRLLSGAPVCAPLATRVPGTSRSRRPEQAQLGQVLCKLLKTSGS